MEVLRKPNTRDLTHYSCLFNSPIPYPFFLGFPSVYVFINKIIINGFTCILSQNLCHDRKGRINSIRMPFDLSGSNVRGQGTFSSPKEYLRIVELLPSSDAVPTPPKRNGKGERFETKPKNEYANYHNGFSIPEIEKKKLWSISSFIFIICDTQINISSYQFRIMR